MTDQSFETMRQAMVSNQLRTTAVNDSRVVTALREVPREDFVPADRAKLAYVDIAVPLDGGRSLNPPMATGRLLTEARPNPLDRAMVIGAATGYAAALLAKLVKSVVAIEEDEALAAKAKQALAGTGVEVVQSALADGHSAGAPYDLILIDGAVEVVPEHLIDQLADGGRLAAGLVDQGVLRLAIGHRRGTGFAMIPFADADTVILPGFAKPRCFTF